MALMPTNKKTRITKNTNTLQAWVNVPKMWHKSRNLKYIRKEHEKLID
jgi:hypothetical protein